jgi:hypothetical protein
MRLFPPVPLLTRVVTRNTELAGCRIPAGATVIYSAYLMHRRPELFENPGRFDPPAVGRRCAHAVPRGVRPVRPWTPSVHRERLRRDAWRPGAVNVLRPLEVRARRRHPSQAARPCPDNPPPRAPSHEPPCALNVIAHGADCRGPHRALTPGRPMRRPAQPRRYGVWASASPRTSAGTVRGRVPNPAHLTRALRQPPWRSVRKLRDR